MSYFQYSQNLILPQFSNPQSYESFSKNPLVSPFENNKEIGKMNSLIDFDVTSQYIEINVDNGREEAVVDRYIPNRRMLKKQSLIKDDQQCIIRSNQNNPPPPVDPRHYSIAEIYKKCIASKPEQSICKDSAIDTFRNKNIFKFQISNKQLRNTLQAIQFGNKEFNFTQQIVNDIKSKRKISKIPFKVLDAPALQDDFYLNLIDWSQQNYLAVGLASNVYLWNGQNSKVSKLCDLGLSDTVTSVGWSVKGPIFSLGTNNGQVHIWDINKNKRTRVLHGHSNRVSSIAWNTSLLSSGSRDKTILHRDIRCGSSFIAKLTAHKQQVCGLKWSPDEQQLCSGGNDNKLMVWSNHSTSPILKYSDHLAAVKAVAWSPHQHGLLASGGGTADKSIKFRNTLTGQTIKTIDTGSQVCNLMFSKTLNQLVSTHGYSFNEINIWKYPKMEKVSTLLGHTMRVLYLTMSPDGTTIVTGAGDETLRFWNVFPTRNHGSPKTKTIINNEAILLR